MLPFLKEQYGNPSSIHRQGRLTRKAMSIKLENKLHHIINADPAEILITSGGTESNNTALMGILSQFPSSQIITSSIEHDAILEPCKKLNSNGFHVDYLPVDNFGMVDTSDLQNIISEKTSLVSVMFGNNEVGTIQPIAKIAKICDENKVLFIRMQFKLLGKLPIDVKELGVDLLSISSHKLHGPKGIGALYIKDGVKIDPIILGGGQEFRLRSGTENVASIVGFGQACEIAENNLSENILFIKKLQTLLIKKVLEEIPETIFNGHSESRLYNNTHFTFLGVNGEDLIIKLDEYGIAASTGSACSVNTQKASHVLEAMGFSLEQITGSLRLTVGIFNTENEINETVEILKKIIEELRAVSPFKEKYSFESKN